ncbi:hypothetical protein M1B34_14625 [Pseudomonas sp. MAFF 302030]|uniref:ApeA N-terminal domain-containing protein n=1 Tax=Pseudomonas morbosilactucae TaxID=2938197 RepID=A0A9X1YVL6_9PSED|nr:HEPN domain-containing protein [Pseudomonas morbosilactucae]MCK9798915.1 hypothetical protein [Pseudomonas morbosilactucae]
MRLGKKIQYDLDKSYDVKVTVTGESGVFFGRLVLSPQNITLRISGDMNAGRQFGNTEWKLDVLECNGFDRVYLLYDLHCVEHFVSALDYKPEYNCHYEAEYIASYALILKGDVELYGLELLSPVLEHWIGYTEKQEEIVRDQVAGQRVGIHAPLDAIDAAEFSLDVDGLGKVGVWYNIQASASPLEFNVGVKFPPSFKVITEERVEKKDIMNLYQKVYAFLSTLHGSDFPVERIKLIVNNSIFNDATLYYSQPKLKNYQFQSYSFFPLGNGLRMDSLGLPKLPLDSIGKYFSQTYNFSEKWEKYIKYRRMINVEDRFLGYFRQLESLTTVKKGYLDQKRLEASISRIKPIMIKFFGSKKDVEGLLSGIPRLNNSKYNTAKCILEFYKKIPEELRGGLLLAAKDITSVCKLRNDISHANEYFETEENLSNKCDFIEGLLVMALLETIGIPISTTAKLINRL